MKEEETLSCKNGLAKNVIPEDVFNREIALCGKLSEENGGRCGWGECSTCGVIPLLVKLHKGKLLEDKEVADAKRKILKRFFK